MNITATQLQTQHKALIDALKRGETVNLSYHGQPLGIVMPVSSGEDKLHQVEAMNQFFGMHKGPNFSASSDVVESELREIRKGRRRTLNDI
ncbi:MAG: hypothetical protein KZQ83_07850 [gamma proteobacterium symbiont of Taylorina sp.]|nr:hypothetical protein [gamma proteobacterium symbiont of Taylorina sp.]